MAIKQFLVLATSFVAGTLVYQGQVVSLDADKVKDTDTNLKAIDGDVPPAPVVEIAAIAPTGPNPTAPQQIAPDARQTAAGTYVQPDARLVGEVTLPQEVRTAGLTDPEDDAQGKLNEMMADAIDEKSTTQNNDDALVAGTVAEVTAGLGGKTDDELAALRAAEVDREQPRKGVLKAIDAELDARKADA